MRTVANLQLHYAMRSKKVIWYMQGFAKFHYIANFVYTFEK